MSYIADDIVQHSTGLRTAGLEQYYSIEASITNVAPDGTTLLLLDLPRGPVQMRVAYAYDGADASNATFEVFYSASGPAQGSVVLSEELPLTTTPGEFDLVCFLPEAGVYGIRVIMDASDTVVVHGIQLDFHHDYAQDQWVDVTTLSGYTFSRSTVATDGAPEAGLPADDVDDYGIDVLRDVSTKLSDPGWVLLEGSRTNSVLYSAGPDQGGWGTAGGTVLTGGQADPSGGTEAVRVESPSGNNMVLTTISSPTAGDAAFSAFTNKGAGSGVFNHSNINDPGAVGGTATAWLRASWQATLTGANTQFRVNNGNNTSSYGGLAAGDRDSDVCWCQLEVSSGFPSSYIRTSGSAVTRAADDLSVEMPTSWATDGFVIEYRPEHGRSDIQALGTILLLGFGDLMSGGGGVVMNYDGAPSILVYDTDLGIGAQLSSVSGIPDFTPGTLIRIEVDWKSGLASLYYDGDLQYAALITFGGTAKNWGIRAGQPVYLGGLGGVGSVFGCVRYGSRSHTGV